ncbi:phosphatase PAP2 family protein [Novosphingobium endophyticum]|nr:phosphatase PAP2 family protein [Novosphingobium endophyticum]
MTDEDAAGTMMRPHIRGWPIDGSHALAAAVLCWAGFALTAGLVLTGRTASFDEAGLRLWWFGPDVVSRGPAWLVEGIRDLTAMGGVLLRHLFALGALAALLFLKLRREALILAGTVIGGWLANSLVKLSVGRERPAIVPHLTEAGGNSFPSGHSFNSAVVYIAIALAFAAMSSRRPVRWTIVGGGLVLTWAISISRVWLGVHFPSDVIAGWLSGAGWAFLAALLLDRPAREAAKRLAEADSEHIAVE